MNGYKTSERNNSGFIGVTLHKPNGKWRARVFEQGGELLLGYYDTPEKAAEARLKHMRKQSDD